MAAATAVDAFPLIDAAQQDCITDEQARFFLENGLLIIRNVIRGQELKEIQDQTQTLIDKARAGTDEPDYAYKTHEITKQRVPMRVEYVVDKLPACKVLAGHPFILRAVEKLQGPNFVPTWDSMVFKNPGAGAAIPWHRDGGVDCVDAHSPIFNVDFYLDGSDISNCLWGIPGSNLWPVEEANGTIQRLNKDGFHTEGTIPILMNPGDVILHNILALHGSPATQSKLRRVLYYEYRAAEIESKKGPHKPEYIPLKQKVLLATLRDRAQSPFSKDETPFVYRPTVEFKAPTFSPDEQLPTYRYPHGEYWRAGNR